MHCYGCGAMTLGGDFNFCGNCGEIVQKEDIVVSNDIIVPSDIVEFILTNSEGLEKFKSLKMNEEFINGYRKSEILNALSQYLMNDIIQMRNHEQKIKVTDYTECIKKIFSSPYALTNFPPFEVIKQISLQFDHYYFLMDEWLFEEFMEIQLDKGSEHEKLQRELSDNDYTNYSLISHYVAIGHPGFNTQEAFEYVFRGIIDHGLIPNDYDIIMRNFATLVANKSNLKHCKIFLESKDGSLGSYGPTGLDALGLNEENLKCISLNPKNLRPDKLIDNIETIFHEVHHGVQMTSPKYESYETLQIVKDKFLSKKYGEEYYNENYWVFSSEVDAMRVSWYQASTFVGSFTEKGKALCQEKHEEKMKQIKDSELRILTTGNEETYYTVDELFQRDVTEALGNPKLNSILSQEYNTDGKRKLITEFLRKKEQGNSEFYNQLIFEHKYSMGEIDDNLSDLLAHNFGGDSISRSDGFDIVTKIIRDLEYNLLKDELNKKGIDKVNLEILIAKTQALLEKVVGEKVDVNVRNMFINQLEPTLANIETYPEEQTGYGRR